MRQSKLFTKIAREFPKDEETINAKLLTQAGFVDKLAAGIYSYLPLGLRVLRKIENIVREEINAVGGEEVLMPMLHPKAIWETTGGWEKIDVLFKLKSRTDKDYVLGQSEEEVVTPLVLGRMPTYKELPIAAYQIHWKFRDELRSKSGLLRGREFLMKDMYSFHATEVDFQKFYELVKIAYLKIFTRLGLVAKVTEASGGSFSEKISYEFMVLTDAGEDNILYCDQCEFCVNKDIAKDVEDVVCPKCKKGKLKEARASEVGNVFDLGQKYSKDFDIGFAGEDGKKHFPIMGCYGIGISRLMGVIVEKCHDEKGIIWPESVAPLLVHLVVLLGKDDEAVRKVADQVYEELQKKRIEVLYDDRSDVSAGEKFAEADLLGIPYRVVLSARNGDKLEVKARGDKEAKLVSFEELLSILKSNQ